MVFRSRGHELGANVRAAQRWSHPRVRYPHGICARIYTYVYVFMHMIIRIYTYLTCLHASMRVIRLCTYLYMCRHTHDTFLYIYIRMQTYANTHIRIQTHRWSRSMCTAGGTQRHYTYTHAHIRIHAHTYVYYINTQVEPLHDIQLAVYKDIEELARIVCSGDFLGRQQVYVYIRMHTYAYVYVRMHMHTVLETS